MWGLPPKTSPRRPLLGKRPCTRSRCGFHPPHLFRRDARVAEGGGLLNRYTCNSVSGVRIPLSPPVSSTARWIVREMEPAPGPFRGGCEPPKLSAGGANAPSGPTEPSEEGLRKTRCNAVAGGPSIPSLRPFLATPGCPAPPDLPRPTAGFSRRSRRRKRAAGAASGGPVGCDSERFLVVAGAFQSLATLPHDAQADLAQVEEAGQGEGVQAGRVGVLLGLGLGQ